MNTGTKPPPGAARQVGCAVNTVKRWRQRWQTTESLRDAPRPGCRRTFTALQRTRIIALACSSPCEHGKAWGRWSGEKLADVAVEQHMVTSISPGTIRAWLRADKINRLKEVGRQDRNPQVYPFIMIGLDTSMRLMEILSIRREHVDLDRRMIDIPRAKGGRQEQPITAQLSAYLAQYMEALPDDAPWLFPSKHSRPGHTVNIRKPFRRVVAAAGLDPDEIVRHTLRHTAITHLVQANVDLPTVKRISEHKTLRMVERYAHHHGGHIRAAMDKPENRYAEGC